MECNKREPTAKGDSWKASLHFAW